MHCFCCLRELLTYTDGNKPLAETDLDNIAKAKPVNIIVKEEEPINGNEKKDPFDSMKQSESLGKNVKLSTENNEADCSKEVKESQVECGCGTNSQEAQIALKLGFTLPASCYATMAIRELLKTSTSVRDFISFVCLYVILINLELEDFPN